MILLPRFHWILLIRYSAIQTVDCRLARADFTLPTTNLIYLYAGVVEG